MFLIVHKFFIYMLHIYRFITVTVCSHNTDNVLYDLYIHTFNQMCKYWLWLLDDGFFVNRNMLEQFYLF